MKSKAVAFMLVFAMSVSPVLASDLTGSIKAAVDRELAQTAAQARGSNPYKVASIALVGGGGLLVIGAFAFPSGAKCETTIDASYTTAGVDCGTTTNKGLLFSGIAAVGAGAFLYMKGERQRSSPEIVVHGGRFLLRERITW